MTDALTETAPPQRSSRALASTVLAGALLFLLFIALGTWQVQRRAWKLDLIQQVETRVHAPPMAAPITVAACTRVSRPWSKVPRTVTWR